MNDDKAAEEIKNVFPDFKILATKINNDNKNRKKKLEETKKTLEVCKQEYQKLFYELDNLEKTYCELEQKLKIQKPIPTKQKRKYCVVNHNYYEPDRESDASTDENEVETNTDDNDGNDDDDDYDKTIKKRETKKEL